MLRITIISALAVLGSVTATVYTDVGTFGGYGYPGNSSNEYFGMRPESSDGDRDVLVIKREITEKHGIQLCETWKYDERALFGAIPCLEGGQGGGGPVPTLPPYAGDIIHGPRCRELCRALDDLADRDPPFPRPDEALGLRGHRCPLKEGSYRIPFLAMPDPLRVHFTLRPYYTDYSSGLFPKGECTSNTGKAFAFVDVIFTACKKKC